VDVTRETSKRSVSGLYPERKQLSKVLEKLAGVKSVWFLSNRQKDSSQVTQVTQTLAVAGFVQTGHTAIGAEDLYEFVR
jgi:tRNA pseudouridine-54 N-methylase